MEAGLEVLFGVGGWGERSEGSGASLGRVALCHAVWAFEAEPFGLVDGLLELMALEDGREVEERAGGGGDGDAVPHRDLVVGENGSVKEESGSLGSRPWGRDVDSTLPLADVPQRAGGPVAQDAVGRERGGHPAASL